MHVTKTETKWIGASSSHGWRWVCATCGEVGEWVATPKLAERQGIAHIVKQTPELPMERIREKR